MKGLNWNGTIRFPYPLSSLNETLLRVIRNRVLKQADWDEYKSSCSAGIGRC